MAMFCRSILILVLLTILPLNAGLTVQNEPATIIRDGFKKPEGVAFSPSGHCMAVACSLNDSITLYKRIGSTGASYEKVPICVIQSHDLHYVHDIDFSPCGNYLAAASREANRVAIYQWLNAEKCLLKSDPHWILDNLSSDPASLSFSPCGGILAICKRMGGSGISFHRQLKEGIYEPLPFFELTETKLLEYGLSSPHGVAFSPDGKSIATAHKRFFKNRAATGDSAVAVFAIGNQSVAPSFIDFRAGTSLHSIDFHPTGRYFVIIDENCMASIYSKDEQTHQFARSFDIPFKISSKGCAFSPDGRCLAVTTVEPSILLYTISVDD